MNNFAEYKKQYGKKVIAATIEKDGFGVGQIISIHKNPMSDHSEAVSGVVIKEVTIKEYVDYLPKPLTPYNQMILQGARFYEVAI